MRAEAQSACHSVELAAHSSSSPHSLSSSAFLVRSNPVGFEAAASSKTAFLAALATSSDALWLSRGDGPCEGGEWCAAVCSSRSPSEHPARCRGGSLPADLLAISAAAEAVPVGAAPRARQPSGQPRSPPGEQWLGSGGGVGGVDGCHAVAISAMPAARSACLDACRGVFACLASSSIEAYGSSLASCSYEGRGRPLYGLLAPYAAAPRSSRSISAWVRVRVRV